jgi:hypothetical protein
MAVDSLQNGPSGMTNTFAVDIGALRDTEAAKNRVRGNLDEVTAIFSSSEEREVAETRDDVSTVGLEERASVATASKIGDYARSVGAVSSTTTSVASSDSSSDLSATDSDSDSDSDISVSESRGGDPTGVPPTVGEIASSCTSNSESRGVDSLGTTPTGGELQSRTRTSDSESRESNIKCPVATAKKAEDTSSEDHLALPPLAPRRVISSSSGLLRRSFQKSVPSFFFRCQSNPTKPKEASNITALSTQDHWNGVQDVGRACVTKSNSGLVSQGSNTRAGDNVASDHSVGSDHLVVSKSLSRETVESLIGVKYDFSEDEAGSTVYGVAKDASSDPPFGGAISATSSEINDPWPNPWSTLSNTDATQVQNAPLPGPQNASDNKTPVSVLDSVVGVVLSSNLDESPKDLSETYLRLKALSLEGSKDTPEMVEEVGSADPADGQQTECTEEPEALKEIGPHDPNKDLSPLPNPTRDELTKQPSSVASVDFIEIRDDANGWEELLAQEAADLGVDQDQAKPTNTEENQGGNNKAHKQSSLWGRTKSILRAKQDKGARGERKKRKKGKVRLGWLLRLNPYACTKLSTIKEIEEKAGDGRKLNDDATMKSALRTDRVVNLTESDQAADAERCEELTATEIMSNIESYIVIQADGVADPVTNSFVEHPSETMTARTPKQVYPGAVTDSGIDETKSDGNNLPSLTPSKQLARSWLDELPSMESMLGRDPHTSFSEEASSFYSADISKVDSTAWGASQINYTNDYVAGATKAMKHNFYDVPRREFEKLKEMVYIEPTKEENTSLMDKDITATEKGESIYTATKNMKGKERMKSKNLFTMIFSELADVLECGCGDVRRQPFKKRFEEEKVESMER